MTKSVYMIYIGESRSTVRLKVLLLCLKIQITNIKIQINPNIQISKYRGNLNLTRPSMSS